MMFSTKTLLAKSALLSMTYSGDSARLQCAQGLRIMSNQGMHDPLTDHTDRTGMTNRPHGEKLQNVEASSDTLGYEREEDVGFDTPNAHSNMRSEKSQQQEAHQQKQLTDSELMNATTAFENMKLNSDKKVEEKPEEKKDRERRDKKSVDRFDAFVKRFQNCLTGPIPGFVRMADDPTQWLSKQLVTAEGARQINKALEEKGLFAVKKEHENEAVQRMASFLHDPVWNRLLAAEKRKLICREKYRGKNMKPSREFEIKKPK